MPARGFFRRLWRTLCFAWPWACEHYLLTGGGRFHARLRHWLARRRVRQELVERPKDVIEIAKYSAPQVQLMEELIRAAHAYVPRAYDGKVQVYCATSERPLTHLATMDGLWKTIAPAARIIRVPGAHQTLFTNKRCAVLRQHLAAVMQGN